MGGDELDYIHDAFEKNWIAPLGSNVNGFEEDLSNYTGSKNAAVVTSGTAAIHLALILCGVQQDDEVICQSFTFTATANPIRYQGATPVFIDSEADTWNMDPELLEEAIEDRIKKGKKPKAIIIVHLYGMPAKMNRILDIGLKYNIPIIEDAAEALGSEFEGRKCGSFGKLSILSFNGNKIITTSGGGAILSDNENLIRKARFLATQARDEAPHYEHSQLGYNYRMSNIVAGIGRGQMKVLNDRVAKRRWIHDYYFEALDGTWLEQGKGCYANFSNNIHTNHNSRLTAKNSKSGFYFLKEPVGTKSNRWLTTVIINPEEMEGVTREDIRVALEKKNIESRPLWKPMHMQPLYQKFPYYGSKVELSDVNQSEFDGLSGCLFEYGLCLPSGSNMSDKDLERVIDAIQEVIAVTK